MKACRLGGGATNGFLTKPPVGPLRPLGLKGATGGAAGLLNAAMRSLNELLLGFSETGGGPGLGLGAGLDAAGAAAGGAGAGAGAGATGGVSIALGAVGGGVGAEKDSTGFDGTGSGGAGGAGSGVAGA